MDDEVVNCIHEGFSSALRRWLSVQNAFAFVDNFC